MLLESFDEFINEGFFTSKLDHRTYWIEFVKKLSSLIGKGVKAKINKIEIDYFDRYVEIEITKDILLTLHHDWSVKKIPAKVISNDYTEPAHSKEVGTKEKPETGITVSGEKYIMLGTYTISDDAEIYADSIYQEIKRLNTIQNIKIDEAVDDHEDSFSLKPL